MSKLEDHWEYENGPIVMRRKVYYKSDVDAVIAEKDRALEYAKALTLKDIETLKEKDKKIAELQAKLESEKASRDADSVDAGMRERRLKRVLWLVMAERAKERKIHFDNLDYFGISDVTINFESARTWMTCKTEEPSKWAIIFEKVEQKCRAKAEEYK